MKKIIGVKEEGFTGWHLVSDNGDFATLCGLDGDDPMAGQLGLVEPRRGQKVTCPQCKSIWLHVVDLRMKKSDFAV